MKKRDLQGKTALVTGAASGIGRATALLLRDRGARLVVCDVNETDLASLVRELGAACLVSRRVDVSKRDEMRALADLVHENVPAVDVLVNNAGVGLSGGLLDTPLEDWDWIVNINMWGVIHACHLFVPAMVARGAGGHVVNVSSVLGVIAMPEALGYCTTKFAVFGLSEGLRLELAPHGIGVSTICPGVIDTNIVRASRFHGKEAKERQVRATERWEQRKYGPEKVAAAILDAIERDVAVRPVAPEAWAAFLMKRLSPSVLERFSTLIAKHIM